MMTQFSIGEIKVTGIREYYGPTHAVDELLPELDRSLLQRHASWIEPDHYNSTTGRLVVAIQIWVAAVDDKIIVIDTGVGNRKHRLADRMHQLNSLFLYWLEAAGAPREKVTHVVQTHLHTDHVGWNTMLIDGRWEPTFPNAKYFMPKVDIAFLKREIERGVILYRDPLGDSIMPIIDAGMATLTTSEKELADVLKVLPSPGHTPGHMTFWIESQGEQGVFSADIFHHPLQIYQPECNSFVCALADDARRTRADFLERAATTGAIIMPCHFGSPHCGHVRRSGDGFAFEPFGRQ